MQLHGLTGLIATDGPRLLGEVTFQAALMLSFAVAAGLGLQRLPARHHKALWTAAIAGLLLLPILSASTPSWSLGWFAPPSQGSALSRTHRTTSPAESLTADHGTALPFATIRTLGDRSNNTEKPLAVEEADLSSAWMPIRAWRPSVAGAALGLWLFGVALGLCRLALGWIRLRGILRRSYEASQSWQDLVGATADDVGVQRPVRLQISAEVAGPMTCGFRRPVVVVPVSSDAWTTERRRIVLLHELVHVRRSDWLVRSLARLACALYWPNPLAWIAVRRLIAAQEQACDDEVVALGTRPSTYARHLLDLARSMIEWTSLQRRGLPAPPTLEMARRTTMEGRLMSILDPSRPTETTRSARAQRRVSAPFVLAAFLLLPLIAAVDPWSANADSGGADLMFQSSDSAARADGPARDLNEVVADIQALETRMAPFNEELRTIQTRLEPSMAELETLEARLEPTQERIQTFDAELEPYQTRLEAIQAELEPYHARLQAIEVEMKPYHERLETLHRELEPLEERLERVAGEMEPAMGEVEGLSERIEPYHEQLNALHQEMESELGASAHGSDNPAVEQLQERMEAVHREMQPVHEELDRIHQRMEPHHERMDAIHREMEPVHERMNEVHSEMSEVHERMEAVHREMQPLYERMEAIYREMEPIHEQMSKTHVDMEPVHREMEAVHQRMEPIHREMEDIHERMEPLHREMEEYHRELMISLRRELRQRLSTVLGRSASDPEIARATEQILDKASINIKDGRIKLWAWRDDDGLAKIVGEALNLPSTDPTVGRVVAAIDEIEVSPR